MKKRDEVIDALWYWQDGSPFFWVVIRNLFRWRKRP